MTTKILRDETLRSSFSPYHDHRELIIGLDIGTQNTTAVFKNGEKIRELKVSSIIGRPKNEHSREKISERLGRPLAYDQEVFNSTIAQNIDLTYPLKSLHDDQDEGPIQGDDLTDQDDECMQIVAERVLSSRMIEEFLTEELDSLKIAFSTPSTTANRYKEQLTDCARRHLPSEATPSFLVESEVHFVGYHLSKIDHEIARDGAIIVDIGAGTTDFHAYTGNPTSKDNTLSFARAGKAVTDRLFHLLRDQGFQNTWLEVENMKRSQGRIFPSLEDEDYEEIVVNNLRFQGRENIRGDIGEEMEKAHRPLLEDIVSGFKRFMKSHHVGPVPSTVVLAGQQGQLPGLKTVFQKALHREQYEVSVKTLRDFSETDPVTFTAQGALKRIQNTPLRELTL